MLSPIKANIALIIPDDHQELDMNKHHPLRLRLRTTRIMISLILSLSLTGCFGFETDDFIGIGDCSEATIIGTWRQESALRTDGGDNSWSREDMIFSEDCSLERVEYEGSNRSDQGYFRQRGDKIKIVMDEWSDLTGIVDGSRMTLRSDNYLFRIRRMNNENSDSSSE